MRSVPRSRQRQRPQDQVRYAVCAALVAAFLLTMGCAAPGTDESSPAGSGDASNGAASGDGDTPVTGPVVDPACPAGLTHRQLERATRYPDADVDGDGRSDAIRIGTVTGADGGCRAALVVTTATGTAVAALPGLELIPPRSFVPGAAASIDGQTVVAAPVSFSPRGGGAVGLFTLLDGALVPVERANGEDWTILSTIDDGGGLPQSLGCAGGVLTHTTTTSDGFGGPIAIRETRWTLDGTTATLTGKQARTVQPRPGLVTAGLRIFDDC